MQKLYNYSFTEVLACILLLALSLLATTSRAALAKGDLAIIGYNGDGVTTTKDFAVVALAKINSGETIYITDKGWTATSGGSFMADITTEGIFQWTVTNDIQRGTVIRFAITVGSSASVAATPSVGTLTVINGWTSTSTASPFGTNGDQVLIYQGTQASPSFVFGFNAGIYSADVSSGWQTVATAGNAMSNLPAGLTNASNAVSFTTSTGALDNYAYTGSFTGSKAVVLAAICNTSNWAGDDAANFNIVPGAVGSQFPGSNPIFTVNTIPVASNVNFSGTLKAGETLSGTYTYSDADNDAEIGTGFKWYRSDNVSGLNKVLTGGTLQTYVPTAADVGKYLSFEVTPRDGFANGSALESVRSGPVADAVLPLKLISFSAKLKEGNTIILNWKVAQIDGTKSFVIYRKGEHSSFVKLAEIDAGFNSSAERDFSYTDRLPLIGNNYYKLVEVDLNDHQTELGHQALNLDFAKAEMGLFPNPVKDFVKAYFKAGTYTKGELINTNGKLLSVQQISDNQNLLSFDLVPFPNGIYFIRLSSKIAKESLRFIKVQ